MSPYSNAGLPPPTERGPVADRTIHLLENPGNPYRLGRSVRHDPRSLRYTVKATGRPQTKIWQRRIPVLDQGELGSCTGNATVGVLGTEPFYSQLTPVQRQALGEDEAVRLYSLATQLDDFPGDYPPTDTGSSGLDVAKAAVKLGYLAGFQHITSIAAAQTAIVTGPFLVGTNWYDGMFNPTADGEVKISGSFAGGHEYECYGYDAEADRWHFYNSWGESWAKGGAFWMSGGTFAKLLGEQGDATTFVPVTQPAPTPDPAPPAPVVVPFPDVAWQAFKDHPYSNAKRRAAIVAVDAYRASL